MSSLARCGSSLNICFALGAGSFAFLPGRADNAGASRDMVRRDCPHPPSHHTGRLLLDMVVFDQGALSLLIDVMGQNRVVPGSDDPVPLGEIEVGERVNSCESFSSKRKNKLLGGNAERFFALKTVS